MAALILVKLCLDRRPSRIPYRTVVVNVEITSAHIQRYVIVTVTCDSSESGVHIEAVAACSVRDQGEKALIAKIVDPGEWCFGCRDDVLACGIIKIAVFHGMVSFLEFHV